MILVVNNFISFNRLRNNRKSILSIGNSISYKNYFKETGDAEYEI